MTSKELALTFCEKFQENYPLKRPLWQLMVELESDIEKFGEQQVENFNLYGVIKSEAVPLTCVCVGKIDVLTTQKGIKRCGDCGKIIAR